MKNIIIKKEHSKKCVYLENKEKPRLCPEFKEPIFFGNFAGKKIQFSGYVWMKIICNDSDCKFIGVVRFEEIEKLF